MMKIQKTYTFEIDVDKERERFTHFFADEPQKIPRQLAILDALEAKDLDKVWKLYWDLPYDEENEYPEQENVGMWFTNIEENRNCALEVKIL